MPANITSAPPSLHLAHEPVWWQVQSGVLNNAPGSITLTFTGANSNGNTLRIIFAGYDLMFTAKTTPDAFNAYEWPLFGAGLVAYTDLIAERLRATEAITEYFIVSRSSAGGEKIVLTQRVVAPVSFAVWENMSGISAAFQDVISVFQEPNLSLAVQVWEEKPGGNDKQLAVFQANYRADDRACDLDISAAFSELKAALPDPFSMNYAPPATSGFYGEAPEACAKYYLLFGDKYGTPARAQLFQRSDSLYAIHGSLSGDSQWQYTLPLRHVYRNRQFVPFRKPVVCEQPDWMYVWTDVIDPDTECFLSVLAIFDDNTEMNIAIQPPGSAVLQPNTLYWFATGFEQLGLQNTVMPPGATRIVAYDVRLYPPDLAGEPLLGAQVQYRVEARTDYEFFLLFDNGVGGCETVSLRGKRSDRYTAKAEEYNTARGPLWEPTDGDMGVYAQEGRKEWEASTGLYDRDDAYLEHLLQLPLGQCWLIDTFASRFLPVRVEGREMTYRSDDDTLASISFTIRALWTDRNYNV